MPNLIGGLALAIIGNGYAADMYFISTFKGGTGSAGHPCWDFGDVMGKYCTCSGSAFTTVTCNSTSRQVSYTSINKNHAGTSSDPYVLSGCVHVGCLCGVDKYWSGSQCVDCPKSQLTNLQTYGSAQKDHLNTSCAYCGANNYKDVYKPAAGVNIDVCYPCPSGGKKASSTGGITECCLDAGDTMSDTTGKYTCGAKACYVQ